MDNLMLSNNFSTNLNAQLVNGMTHFDLAHLEKLVLCNVLILCTVIRYFRSHLS